jgi:hypothetical protein
VSAAARRIALIVAGVLGLTVAASGLAGVLLGVELGRAVSVGLYVVGCFFVVLGFFSGLRGPVRPRGGHDDEGAGGLIFGVGLSIRGARTATEEERADARGTTWLFIGLGIALIVTGILVDGRVGLVGGSA